LFLQAKELNSITNGRFYIWGRKSTKKDQNDGGARPGSFTMTMHQHKMLCQCSNFWTARNVAVVLNILLSWFGPCLFFLFLRKKLQLNGCRFQDVSNIQEQ
jgi:hypothetical protein